MMFVEGSKWKAPEAGAAQSRQAPPSPITDVPATVRKNERRVMRRFGLVLRRRESWMNGSTVPRDAPEVQRIFDGSTLTWARGGTSPEVIRTRFFYRGVSTLRERFKRAARREKALRRDLKRLAGQG